MTISLIRRKIIFLLQVKKVWHRPRHAKVLIYDRSGSELFLSYLKNEQLEILDTRGESLNMPALFQSLMSGWRKKTYESCYIDMVNPKVAITFIDNNPVFYSLKTNRPSLTTVFVQNGLRSVVGDIFSHLVEHNDKNQTKYHVDHMLCFGKSVGDEYVKYIAGNYTSIGSFKNNLIAKSTHPVKENSILFLSQYRKKPIASIPFLFNAGVAVLWEEFFSPEAFFLPLLSVYCKQNGLKLQVCGCLTEARETEFFYYKALLGSEGWEFIPRDGKTNSYHLVDEASIIFMIDSTLGYEAMARRKKVAAFPTRGKLINSNACDFGWPAKVDDNGPFWTNTINAEEFNRIMDYVLHVDDDEWEKVLLKFTADLITYDPGNTKFLNLMKVLQVSLN